MCLGLYWVKYKLPILLEKEDIKRLMYAMAIILQLIIWHSLMLTADLATPTYTELGVDDFTYNDVFIFYSWCFGLKLFIDILYFMYIQSIFKDDLHEWASNPFVICFFLLTGSAYSAIKYQAHIASHPIDEYNMQLGPFTFGMVILVVYCMYICILCVYIYTLCNVPYCIAY